MYTDIRKKLYLKSGGIIAKFQTPATPIFSDPDQQSEYEYLISQGYSAADARNQIQRDAFQDVADFKENATFNQMVQDGVDIKTADNLASDTTFQNGVGATTDSTGRTQNQQIEKYQQTKSESGIENGIENAAGLIGAGKSIVNSLGKAIGKGGEVGAAGISAGIDAFLNGDKKAGLAGTIGGAGVMAVNAVDQLAMGDKNFGSQSEAIDGAVHTVSGALMKSGNVWAMTAGAALEGVNFLTKAGGQTVQGFDVDIDSSGYGNIGHMESSSSRSWVSHRKLQDKLSRRNEQVRTALAAAQISEDQKFESEARMNSVENTIMNNQIALAGGLQTNLLGS